jgi:3-hydroxyisobutyrate dehydrogenase
VRNKIDLAACEVVFTMVSTTDDLKEVLFGEGGLVTGAKKPQVVVDSSSISQEGSAEIRAQLEGWAWRTCARRCPAMPRWPRPASC